MNLVDYKSVTQKSYDSTAAQYCSNVAQLHPVEFGKSFITGLPMYARILDLGCGSGRDAYIFSQKGCVITAMDFSKNLIAEASKTAALADFVIGDIELLPFREQSFEGIWACASLLHVPKLKMGDVLKSLHKILAPDGIFAFSLKEGDGEGLEEDKRYNNVKKYFSYWNSDPLKTCVIAAGFTILSITNSSPISEYNTQNFFQVLCKKESSVHREDRHSLKSTTSREMMEPSKL